MAALVQYGMLTVICGEDTVQARQYLQEQVTAARKKGAEVRVGSPRDLEAAIKDGTVSSGLFSSLIVFQTNGLVGHLAKKRQKKPQLAAYAADTSITILDWEGGKSAYTLGLQKESYVKEFRPSADIFQLLGLIQPGKKVAFVQSLRQLIDHQDPVFVYTMIHRRVRSLIVLGHDPSAEKLHPFQKKQMISQAQQWDQKKLIGLYEGLCRIDRSLKTNASPLSIPQSLEILACFYV